MAAKVLLLPAETKLPSKDNETITISTIYIDIATIGQCGVYSKM